MKQRLGFVSNSSSSSFCIYGAVVSEKNVKDTVKRDGYGDLCFSNSDGVSPGLLAEYPGGENDYIDYSNDKIHRIGVSITSMRDDQTFGDFKKMVEHEIAAFINGDFKCSVIEKGWYDG